MRAPQIRSPRRTIRFWLNALVIACILPAALGATYLIARSYARERASLERDTVATARALMQAVDADLAGIQAVLQILATSSHLASGQLDKFYDQAREALRDSDGGNIVLTDSGGQQLINTLKPIGERLPLHGNPDQLRSVLETGRPVISDLFIGAVTRSPLISIEVPVYSNGKPVYGLAMGIFPERLSEVLRRQKTPSGWVTGILDRTGTIVARTDNAEQFVGKKGSAPLLRSIAEMPEGMMDGVTLEGIPVLGSFSSSPRSGWTVAIGIPKGEMVGQLWRAAFMNVTAAIILLGVAALLATAISGHISRSFAALTVPTLALGSSEPVAVPSLKIQEAYELAQALAIARNTIEQRSTERDEAEAREHGIRQKLEVLFESAPNGVLVTDNEEKIYLLNAQMERMFGYSRAELIGLSVDVLVPERFRNVHSAFRKTFAAAPQTRPMGAGRDLFGRRKDGTEFPVEIGLNPIKIKSRTKGAIMITVVDISVRKLAEAKLAAATAERDDLRRRIMRAQEQERLRLAHDLHDQTGQSLAAAMLELKGVESLVNERGRDRLRLLRGQMEEMGKTLHRVAWELRPASIDELGLASAIANYISDWSTQSGITADFHCTDLELDALSDEVRTTIYRVVQEALTNIAKHAEKSSTVSVVVERVGASLRLMIEDDGCGFQNISTGERNGGLGLLGMRERLSLIGGALEIETSSGTGTTIFARIPLQLERLSA
jgi:PAS domain S-box-containing protein